MSPFPFSIHTLLKAAIPKLEEATSKSLIEQIKVTGIETEISPQEVPTAYVHWGKIAPPLLLLHGFDSSVLEFRRLIPLLSAHYETWAVDLFGFGFTERPLGVTFSPQQILRHLYAFWQQKIQQPVILVGASMGGAAAIDFVLQYPEIVAQLILLDSAGVQPGPIIGKYLFPPLDGWAVDFLRRPGVRRRISRSAYDDPNRFVTEDAEICASLHLAMPRWHEALKSFTKSGGYPSWRSRLPDIQQSTLILWGQQDRILGTKAAKIMDELIPNSNLSWVDACGHVPHLEQAQTTAQRILEFTRQAPLNFI